MGLVETLHEDRQETRPHNDGKDWHWSNAATNGEHQTLQATISSQERHGTNFPSDHPKGTLLSV